MCYKKNTQNKGQALAELAILGSLMLAFFGVLLSFTQAMNNKQYVQMETFRRALGHANTYDDKKSESGIGASIQYQTIEDRRNVDLAQDLHKRSPTTTGAGANVLWAVPRVGGGTNTLIGFKINADEKVYNMEQFIPKEHQPYDEKSKKRDSYWQFSTEEGRIFGKKTEFMQGTRNTESPDGGISNIQVSALGSVATTKIPFQIFLMNKDDDTPVREVTPDETRASTAGYSNRDLIDWTQYLYRDTDDNMQYKYKKFTAPPEPIIRRQTWQTGF